MKGKGCVIFEIRYPNVRFFNENELHYQSIAQRDKLKKETCLASGLRDPLFGDHKTARNASQG